MRARVLAGVVLLVALALTACSSGGGSKATPACPAADGGGTSVVTARGPSAACHGAAALTAGDQKVTLSSAGADRWYWRHVPPSYVASTPIPVVLDFHGYSEGADIHRMMSSLESFGDQHSFVTITPQGVGPVARWDTKLGSKGMKFVGDLLDDVERTLCVDQSRVFATGLSNGAFMSSAIACEYSDRVAAVAPVAGISKIDGCAPKRPVPVIAFHGTADGFVAYDGGVGARVASLPAPDGSGKTIGEVGGAQRPAKGPSIPQKTAAWAERNGCAPKVQQTTVTADVTLLSYSCPKGADVELYRVTGGGHTWPGSKFSQQIESIVGPTTMSISANELMWKFFQAHPLRAS